MSVTKATNRFQSSATAVRLYVVIDSDDTPSATDLTDNVLHDSAEDARGEIELLEEIDAEIFDGAGNEDSGRGEWGRRRSREYRVWEVMMRPAA